MKRCPKCNCGAEFVNKASYYAKQSGGIIVGGGAGLLLGIFAPNQAKAVAARIYCDVTQNVKKKYRCTNSKCGNEWDEK